MDVNIQRLFVHGSSLTAFSVLLMMKENFHEKKIKYILAHQKVNSNHRRFFRFCLYDGDFDELRHV